MKFRNLKNRLRRSRREKKDDAQKECEQNETEDSDAGPEEEEEKPVRENRTVNDFDSAIDLRKALLSDNNKGSFHDTVETGCLLSNRDLLEELTHGDLTGSEAHQMSDVDQKLDWVLENYEVDTTVPQDLDHELRRLLVLKSYLILDTERRESFEKVTGMASRLFSCPIALISLVDLGRQWFLSNRGLGEARETPRKLAFCAHAIASKHDSLVVLDATKDFRFKDSPLVKGPPDIRFYAGAPLISPEGYKLGTLCVIDSKIRTKQQFTKEDKANLIDLAAMAVQALVSHKRMKTAWFNNLERTHFPEFEEVNHKKTDSVPAPDDGADDPEAQYQEDKDVEIFLQKTKRMSLSSFLSVLENQARDLNLSPEYLKKYVSLAKSKPKIKKSVRFVKDRKVRYQVHEVESWKPIKNLWWSPQEMHDIQCEAFSTTLFYRKHRPKFTKSVEIVAKATEPTNVVEDHMRLILEDDKARGLESQIVSLLSGCRKVTVKAVLEEQTKCKKLCDINVVMERLRGQSIAHSKMSIRFAERKAQCDHIDALKASMSKWRPTAGPQIPSKFARIA